MMWMEWWVWASAAVIFGILELILPGYVFLGFGVGAGIVSLLMLIGISLSLPMWLTLCSVFALLAFIALRRLVGIRKGQVKIWNDDINEP